MTADSFTERLMSVLRALGQTPAGLTVREVQNLTGLTRRQVTHALDQLVQANLPIEVIPDGRAHAYVLDRGRFLSWIVATDDILTATEAMLKEERHACVR